MMGRMSTAPDPAHTHHAIDYIEIAVTDLEAAKTFYASAFGWSLVDYGPEYAGIQGDGREMGGLRLDTEVRAGGPLVILYSSNLEDSVAAVGAAGGTIVKAIEPFPGGRRFHFADPAGNELAVWSDQPAAG
jgi:predicted enzyme related to lactoylglutathione lyase